MAIEYNGTTFTVKTAYENALDLVNSVNQYLVDNTILDSDGNQAVVYVNAASPIWLILFAVGAAITVIQNLLQKASDSLSVENCSDIQLLNLLQIAGTDRIAGTKTILFFSVTAGASDATITPADLLPYTEDVDFVPFTTTTIPHNTTVVIEARSSIIGPYYVLPGEITSFKVPPANVVSVANADASIPGKYDESYTEIRRRLQVGGSLVTSIDSAILAIKNLDGIEHCNIFFNQSSVDTLTLPGGITLPPRTARIFVYGTSLLLAETYFTHMTARTTGAELQNYVTLAMQEIPVYYDEAELTNFFVKVVIAADSGQPEYLTEIRNALLPASASLNVGLNYTQQYLLNYLDSFTHATIIGLYVSMDGVTWSDITELDGNQIGVIDTADITAEEK